MHAYSGNLRTKRHILGFINNREKSDVLVDILLHSVYQQGDLQSH